MGSKILRSFPIGLAITAYFITLAGGQTCINNPNANQIGEFPFVGGRQVIVPAARFNCNGRITSIAASLQFLFGTDLPLFQVWRPFSPNSTIYTKISEVELPPGDRMGGIIVNYYFANLSLNSSSQIEFQSGDVIGYFQSPDPQRWVRNIQATGYTSYSNDASNSSASFIDTSNTDNTDIERQPLIEVAIDIKCGNLSTPSNGRIMSCSSGRVGVGYEGDTCSFTCNTGYELTGSDTRICQSDGSWSGIDSVCRRVHCPLLSDPVDGMIDCPLGNDGDLSYEDTCSITCNTGYELTGSNTRTCQSDGSWNGTDGVCTRVQCLPLTNPDNGTINCSLGDDGVPSYEDICRFTCNSGYELTGSDTRTCQSDGSWSGIDSVCGRIRCPLLINPVDGMIDCPLGYDGALSYGDTCSITCDTGYELTGSDTRTCKSDGSWNGTDGVCTRVQCLPLTNPDNGTINCSLGDDGVPSYEDICRFTCNTGYELTGSDTRTCQSDGSWNDTDGVCRRVRCPLLTNPVDGMIDCSLGDDGVPSFEDTCSLTCNTGYELTGSDTRTCQSDGSWSDIDSVCRRVRCPSLTDPNNGMVDCPPGDNGTPFYGDTCNFTCNTGYELTGSDTRTCQSNRTWNGDDVECRRVLCSSLTNHNGTMNNCSLGDDGIPSYEDTCSFICDTGYELTGSDTRTCQSDGSWSGSDGVCRRVTCQPLSESNDRFVNCSKSNVEVPSFQDTCVITCAAGFKLTGNDTQICQSNGRWSGSDNACHRISCSSFGDLGNGTVNCLYGDDRYEDSCSFTCNTGYKLIGSDTRTCQSDGSWSGDITFCIEELSATASVTDISVSVAPTVPPIDDNSTPSDSPSNTGAFIGGIVAAVIITLIFMITGCVLFVIIYHKRSKNLKESTGVSNAHYGNPNHESDYNLYNTVSDWRNSMEMTRESILTISDIEVHRDTQMVNKNSSDLQDYESISQLNDYDVLDYIKREYTYLENPLEVSGGPEPYDTPLSHSSSSVVTIYQDPGHRKEVIYEWFDKMKFRKIHSTNIIALQMLGSGQFGVVRFGLWSNGSTDPVQVAVKTLNSQCSESESVKFLREAAIMGQFVHNNVVQFHGVVTEKDNMMIVLEYMPKGDLREYLIDIKHNGGEYNDLPVKLLNFCRQIAAGMNYLANKQFVHRDLAARNILVSSDDVCKIADFGMARDVADDTYYVTTDGKIPFKWTAPEALFYHKYSTMSDIWSYGCVLYEIWSMGHRPFEAMIPNKVIELLCNGYRLPPPPGCSKLLYKLMIECWNVRPKERPKFSVILRKLCVKDEEILYTDQEEMCTSLGDALTSSSDLYKTLQLTYCNKSTLKYKSIAR